MVDSQVSMLRQGSPFSALCGLWRPTRRHVATAIAALGSTLFGLYQLAELLQRQLIYHARRYSAELEWEQVVKTFSARGYKFQVLDYQDPDGAKHRGLLLSPAEQTRTLWVVFGGNGMVASDWLPFVFDLVVKTGGNGLAFLLLDFPGYGYNEGSPSPATTLRASVAGVRVAVETLCAEADGEGGGGPAQDICYLGHSLGCAAVSQLAATLIAERPAWLGCARPGRLVLSAPFTSIPDMGRALFAGMPGVGPTMGLLEHITRHAWDNRLNLRRLARACTEDQRPIVSIIHGEQDEIVPLAMGQNLHRLCVRLGIAGAFVGRPEAHHNDILQEAFTDFHRLLNEMPPGAVLTMPTPAL